MIHINNSFYTKVNLRILCNNSEYFKNLMNGFFREDLSIILPTINNQDQWRKIEKMLLEYDNIMYNRWHKLTYLYNDLIYNFDLYYIIRHNFYTKTYVKSSAFTSYIESEKKTISKRYATEGHSILSKYLREVVLLSKWPNYSNYFDSISKLSVYSIVILIKKIIEIVGIIKNSYKQHYYSIKSKDLCYENNISSFTYPKFNSSTISNPITSIHDRIPVIRYNNMNKIDGDYINESIKQKISNLSLLYLEFEEVYETSIEKLRPPSIITKNLDKYKDLKVIHEVKPNFILNKTYLDFSEPIMTIQTLSYLQATCLLDIYISEAKKYVLSYKYNVEKEPNIMCGLIGCVANILSDKNLDFIFNKRFTKKYFEIGKNIIESDIDYLSKSRLLIFWSNNFYKLEKITFTYYNYFSIQYLNKNNFCLPTIDKLIEYAKSKTIWGHFLEKYLPINCIFGGGFLTTCIKNLKVQKYNDIDIWVFGNSEIERKNNFDLLIESIKLFFKDIEIDQYIISVNKSIVSVHMNNEMSLQIIYTNKINPIEIISDFDMDYLKAYYINENNNYICYLSSQAINSYITNTTNFCNEKKNIRPSRIMKAIEKGFSITNLSIDLKILENNDEWYDSKYKYFDNYTTDINRNNFLVKRIFKAEFIVNSLNEIKYYFDYIPFSLGHYYSNSLEENKINDISILNLNLDQINDDYTYIPFDKSIIIQNNPIIPFQNDSIEQLDFKNKLNLLFKNIQNIISKKYNITITLINTELENEKDFKLAATNIRGIDNINKKIDKKDLINIYLKFDLIIKGFHLKKMQIPWLEPIENNFYEGILNYAFTNFIFLEKKEYEFYKKMQISI